jgi:flagellar basal-body rod modification protein FlgD
MSTVSAVSGTNTTNTTSSTSSAGSLDYKAFLQLLIAQLKNQDPTAPTDSTQFVAQLATFSQVEQSVTTNSKLDSLLTAQSLSMADAFIGHTVTSSDGETSGLVTSVKITSDGPLATLANGDTILLGSGVSIS